MNTKTPTPNGSDDPPRWDLNRIYPGFDSPKYRKDIAELTRFLEEAGTAVDRLLKTKTGKDRAECIRVFNLVYDYHEELEDFAYSVYSTDTNNHQALQELNKLEEMMVRFHTDRVRFRSVLAEVPGLPEDYRFFLEEELFLAGKQMTPKEESLAADLSRAGGDAWGRLQESVSSRLTAAWDEEGGETKTVTELRELAYHPDRKVRKRAYEKELECWKRMEIPLSFALNGVKGFSTILNGRRSYEDTLERSILQSRITRGSLDCLLEVMEESLPMFRGYLKSKASRLGLERLSFYDIFAPVGKDSGRRPFSEARKIIVSAFREFSPDLARFADNAFANSWIDAEPREGKVGGAYCISFPLAKVSRVFQNYSGSFNSVTTLAHELGHAYHHHLLTETPALLRHYPMTLAETASIFAETLIIDSTVQRLEEAERDAVLETFLQDATQVIVDIYSRFTFEKAIFERRKSGDLCAEEYCGLMLEAQKEAYGDALNHDELHPYMWAVKGHYYNQDLAFYNFPYAFGLLFGLGLYARYRDEGSSFAGTYTEVLKMTGSAPAAKVAAYAGFSIEEKGFWRSGIEAIRTKIDQFAAS
ncbi:MAG: M3 family oligoendopeptidase [bacterium]